MAKIGEYAVGTCFCGFPGVRKCAICGHSVCQRHLEGDTCERCAKGETKTPTPATYETKVTKPRKG